MSRYHPDWDIEPILKAAKHWLTNSLLGQRSIFEDEPVWTQTHLDELNEYFVENPDDGEGAFLVKLKMQLEPSSNGAKKLAAEMIWLLLLSVSSEGAESKRNRIFSVWDWSGEPRPSGSHWVSDEVLRGIGSAGAGFGVNLWRELVFLIKFTTAFTALDRQEQNELLDDGWRFAEWLEQIPDADKRQFRHMLLYLLFPDVFDRLFGSSDRRKLLLSFTDRTGPELARMSQLEISKEIQRIRREQEEKFQTKELDFYLPPLREVWISEEKSTVSSIEPAEQSEFSKATSEIEREHVLSAIREIDKDGYPGNARSSTYDLIFLDQRYPPKYVLSLASKYATGEEFPRQFFSGGKDSQAFRVLENLGFHIERKDFLQELVKDFLAQADESASLGVADYPKEYRGLKVNVSFGKGNFAKVPWISFTGYDQTTSDGIYPVALYFKSVSTLIIAYGISETNVPSTEWSAPPAQTIEAYLQSVVGAKPERYGDSFVHTAFDLSEMVDMVAIEASLDDLIGQYHKQFETKAPGESEIPTSVPYGIDEALADLFIEEETFKEILALLKQKKNVIIQGPPGVGKTFVCKRLAYALMEEKAEDQLGMVQFHQSYSYEDFIQGYRPSASGGFRLKNGVFHEFCEKAKNDPAGTYVFIIDEINRGNLSKIFGELMMLVESDKRGPDWAIPLTYSESDEDKFYIPENVFLLGLMNTADRSLAMVDYALRRRFAFADLKPGFETDEFREYLVEKGATRVFVEDLIGRLQDLNEKIAADVTNLGPGFCIGHSYFCSVPENSIPDWDWYASIIKTEIAPLLREYYFDDDKQANGLVEGLLRS